MKRSELKEIIKETLKEQLSPDQQHDIKIWNEIANSVLSGAGNLGTQMFRDPIRQKLKHKLAQNLRDCFYEIEKEFLHDA